MVAMYTAKNVYKKYSTFFTTKVIRDHVLLGASLMSLIASVAFYLIRMVSSGQKQLLDAHQISNSVNVFLLTAAVLLGFVFTGNYILWMQRFTIQDGQIFDLFPKKKVFRIDDIDHISLISPQNAHIYIKHKKNTLFTCCYWFGKDEADWNHFIGLLIATTPSIADRIYVKSHKYKNSQFVKSSPKDSYPAIQKVFGKKPPSSNEAPERISDTDA